MKKEKGIGVEKDTFLCCCIFIWLLAALLDENSRLAWFACHPCLCMHFFFHFVPYSVSSLWDMGLPAPNFPISCVHLLCVCLCQRTLAAAHPISSCSWHASDTCLVGPIILCLPLFSLLTELLA